MDMLERDINAFLRVALPAIKEHTSDKPLTLIAWVRVLNRINKTLILGFAIGHCSGYSPFVRYYESETIRRLTIELKTQSSELKDYRIYGVATIPPEEIQKAWQQTP